MSLADQNSQPGRNKAHALLSAPFGYSAAAVVNTSARKGLTLRPLFRGVSKKCLRGSVELCQKVRLMAL